MKKLLLAALIALSGFPVAQAADLIVNGSFEQLTPNSKGATGNWWDYPGWSVLPSAWFDSPAYNDALRPTPLDGDVVLRLAYTGAPPYAYAYQNVNVPVAGVYTLKWYDAGAVTANLDLLDPGTYDVYFGTNPHYSLGVVELNSPWMEHTLDVTLGSGTQQVSFRYNNISQGVAYIDKVSLTLAVPEPQVYAMLIAGLGLVGVMARRKSRHTTLVA